MILLYNTPPTYSSVGRGHITEFHNPHLIYSPFDSLSLHVSRHFLNIYELLASTGLPLKEFQCRTIQQTKEPSLLLVTCLMPLVPSFPECHYYGKRKHLWYLYPACGGKTKKVRQILLHTIIKQVLEEKDNEEWCSPNNLKKQTSLPWDRAVSKRLQQTIKAGDCNQ